MTDARPDPKVAPRGQEAAGNGIQDSEPHWRLATTSQNGDGIEKVSFAIDLHEPVATPAEAMRKLTAVALWWIDTDAGGWWNNQPGEV